MATAELVTNDRPRVPVEQRFVLPAVDWKMYQAVSRALTGRHVRLTFDGENLEFMTISPLHGNLSRLLGRLVVVMTEEANLPLKSFGDMTCQREDVARGLEPDECFYITNEPLVRERERIDLASDPPPDLAIEIDVTRSSRDRMAIYAALLVPEVWRFDGKSLTVFQLGDDGQYAAAKSSDYFPQIAVKQIADFLDRRSEMDENKLVAAFRTWVREQITSE